MSYDLYATIPCQEQNDVDGIVAGQINGQEIPDIYGRIQLLAPALLREERWNRVKGKDYAHGKYRDLVFKLPDHANTPYATVLIAKARDELMAEPLGLWQPAVPDMTALPPYSVFLQFRFTLASPYLSRDDEIFHINDKPVRKDRVFKVPMVAGSTWKGNLRWTATHLLVLRWAQDAGQLAENRFRLALLFGDEKGEGESKGLAEYLDSVNPEAARLYREKVHKHFATTDRTLPNHVGRLRCYPTFFDLISLEVINPHDRKTRAGKQPIYFESVPARASGVFSLLYVPFDGVTEAEARADLSLAAEAIREMMLTYGFSAKKSSGFGEAKDDIENGQFVTAKRPEALKRLSTLAEDVLSAAFAHWE